MTMKFRGTAEELEALIASAGVAGEWSDIDYGGREFRGTDGAVLRWWPKKGKLHCQGPPEAASRLENAVEQAVLGEAAGGAVAAPAGDRSAERSIFVVHGHDDVAREQLELVLYKLGLKPFVLISTSGEGKTIIEALEGQIGRDFSSDFGIALLTPDDVGYAEAKGSNEAAPRARQNVILETGMLLASLTRKRMALLVKGHIEMPSDLQGVIHLPFNKHVKEVVPKLCARLREAGIEIDSTKQTEAMS